MGLASTALVGSVIAPIGVLVAIILVVAVLQVRRRARRQLPKLAAKALKPAGPMICPSCMRELPQGTTFCPMDARKLVASDEMGDRRTPGMRCPRCRRAFEGGTRYCPVDAEELIPQAIWEATHGHQHEHEHGGDMDGPDGGGKICPVCTLKYGLDASFCGKDGSELVTMN